jgi:hypothetical protein
MGQIEFDYYIPPNVTINCDGTIDDWTDVYNFDDRDEFFLKSFTGWGMPPIEYIKQSGPYQHGETPLDFRLQPRTIQLVHRRNTCDRTGYWDARSEIIDKLRPNRQLVNTFSPGRLRKILPSGDIRDIYALVSGGMTFTARDDQTWDEFAISESIQFICHNPIVFNPERYAAVWTIGTPTSYLVFPITFPILFGVSGFINSTVSVTYEGTWLAYPTITITGPLDEAIVYNNSTGEKIEIEYNIPNGSTLVIDLSYRQKTVYEDSGTNRIGTITTDSDLATFHIAPDPEVAGGVNELQVIGTNGVAGVTSVSITWYDQYIGI